MRRQLRQNVLLMPVSTERAPLKIVDQLFENREKSTRGVVGSVGDNSFILQCYIQLILLLETLGFSEVVSCGRLLERLVCGQPYLIFLRKIKTSWIF
ncbi:uncharacterized protein PHALS_14660 [Plasmopara halstedii]|uniref:Uncharacterized protein n=1 Tax=Plasmopara halstedii TaxID=4781 RepID=A0A0P1APR1_PLAHL|nr:uncharacterized protein PHALS_14660 [Plasmopara halstedii]CEG42831.1 hypothetical protein PHALS_14660 [Plasmopara halstedii]|eukprot:XP_024579200.1 hypothetical protein PHALS_14660 [Plasmopara halstedii]